jgi:hypothetical protein
MIRRGQRHLRKEATMAEPRTKVRRPQVDDPVKERDDWRRLLDELVRKVQGWVEPEWSTRVIERAMEDSVLGEYNAPALLMQRETTRVILEPVTRFAPGTDGVVDLYRMPAYDDIASLYRINLEWQLHYAFRGAEPVATVREADSLPLEEKNFLRVLDEIAGPAA